MMLLVEPACGYEKAFRLFVADNLAHGIEKYRAFANLTNEQFIEYLDREERMKKPDFVPEGLVPQTTYWLVEDDEKILAVSRLRHWLNEKLLREGGQIGYETAPSQRNRGYGGLVLRLTLEKAAALGLEKVLLTCDAGNLPSKRIIEKNGGIMENEEVSRVTGRTVCRYWIDCVR